MERGLHTADCCASIVRAWSALKVPGPGWLCGAEFPVARGNATPYIGGTLE
jgi:hypothetical protein